MAEYYAVERSPEYLAHYGVKGMRWGVRKALESGNDKRLSKHYNKAINKLAKLNKRADISYNKKEQVKYAKRAALGLGIGALGTAGMAGIGAYKKHLRNNYASYLSDAGKEFLSGIDPNANVQVHVAKLNPLFDKVESLNKTQMDLSNARKAIGAASLAGLAYGGYAGARSLSSYGRTTKRGHEKAVAKRDAWQREMNKAFTGTKYGKKKRK